MKKTSILSMFVLAYFLFAGAFGALADDAAVVKSKWGLWASGKTTLRGANIWQTRSYDGIYDYQLGSALAGPEYTQENFDALAAMGANYVNISHPGLFAETTPFNVDQAAQDNLDALLEKIENADMFAVIAFRSGPGRSEFTFSRDESGDWFKENDLDETVWTDLEKQDAWGRMWRYTAERYKDSPVVVGYDIMVEPNAESLLEEEFEDASEPEGFYARFGETSYDWNQFYPHIVAAIRGVDLDTPILVEGMGYSGSRWFSHIKKIVDPHIVYIVHQYEPFDQYTHQKPGGQNTYPGKFDADYDEEDDVVDIEWLDGLISEADQPGVTVAVNEFGLMRFEPGASDFMKDSFDLFERRGWNHALWMWYPGKYPKEMDEFDFLHGPAPDNHSAVKGSKLIETILANWSLNTVRPSNAGFPGNTRDGSECKSTSVP